MTELCCDANPSSSFSIYSFYHLPVHSWDISLLLLLLLLPLILPHLYLVPPTERVLHADTVIVYISLVRSIRCTVHQIYRISLTAWSVIRCDAHGKSKMHNLRIESIRIASSASTASSNNMGISESLIFHRWWVKFLSIECTMIHENSVI